MCRIAAFAREIVCGSTLLCLFAGPCARSHAQTATVNGTDAPRRLLVVYRNGSIPDNAEQAATRAGGRLLRRHERFGTAVVTASSAGEVQLRADPGVEYVVQDRVISASSVQVRTLAATAAEGRTAPTLRANVPRLVMPAETSDTYYNGSPQGWAVRSVGGFGGGMAGGPGAGPWATTTGAGVRIAVLDSGVDRYHPDISPNLVLNLSEVNQARSRARATTARRRIRAATVPGWHRWRPRLRIMGPVAWWGSRPPQRC